LPGVSGSRPEAAQREIPLSRPYLGEREEELVLEVLRSGRMSLGPTIERFEEMLAERVGARYCAAVSSGTAALHLLSLAHGFGPGDEVITSPLTFVASANCFILTGAAPVFADIDARTLNLDPAAVEAAITERTRAIVAVDIFGYPCELDELKAIAESHGLTLIDDSAQALGAEYKGKPVGGHGVPAIFGFYPNKQLATGEGGAVVTDSEEELAVIVSMRNQGREYSGGAWFHHVRVGLNYRWTDLQAAVGVAQLEKLDEMLDLRRRAADRYGELLAGVDGIELPLADDDDHRRSWFVYVVAVEPGRDRDAVMERLRDGGVQTADYIPSVHTQPYMVEQFGFRKGMFPVAEDITSRTFALPFYAGIEPGDQERVAEVLATALG